MADEVSLEVGPGEALKKRMKVYLWELARLRHGGHEAALRGLPAVQVQHHLPQVCTPGGTRARIIHKTSVSG
jgi:hypothetical protein